MSEFNQSPISTDMCEYVLVFLKASPQSTNDIADLGKEHFNYHQQLIRQGLLLISGPLLDDGVIKSICIYNCSVKDAISLIEEDPAVKAGDLVYEVHPWLSSSNLLKLLGFRKLFQFK